MNGPESRVRRAAWASAMAVCSAMATLAACGGSGFENHPPQPRLNSGSVGGGADFGSVPVGASRQLDVYLSNGQIGVESYETLRGISIAVEGPDLSFVSACPADSLPQASVCPIRLTWAPSAAYALAGHVRVISNAPTSPTTLAVIGLATR